MIWIDVKNLPDVGNIIMLRGYENIKTQPVGEVYNSSENNELCVSFDFTFGGYFWLPISKFKEWAAI
jgi:hypothetical protein